LLFFGFMGYCVLSALEPKKDRRYKTGYKGGVELPRWLDTSITLFAKITGVGLIGFILTGGIEYVSSLNKETSSNQVGLALSSSAENIQQQTSIVSSPVLSNSDSYNEQSRSASDDGSAQPVFSEEVPQNNVAKVEENATSNSLITDDAENNIKPIPSFDCEKAILAVEKLICSSTGLANADRKLADIFESRKRDVQFGVSRKGLRNEQLAWIKNIRNACADEACLIEAYQKRIMFLSASQSAKKTENCPLPGTC